MSHLARRAAMAAMLLGLAAGAASSAAWAESNVRFLSIGTGQVSGVYYPAGRLICEVFNRAFRKDGLYCSVEATPGSVYNLETLERGENEFALVQADVQFAAVKGQARWVGRPQENLRAVLSLYPEVLTIIARKDSGIEGIADLKGKRVNIGNPGSGTRATWDEVSPGLGIGVSDMVLASELKADAAAELLCDGKLDASVMVVGHPSKSVASQLAACDLKLVPATGPAVSSLIAERPYIVSAVIPGSLYGLPGDIQTFGERATLMTTDAMSEEAVYDMTKAILGNLDILRTREPTLAGLQPRTMAQESLTAPLHPGAERALRELGLLP